MTGWLGAELLVAFEIACSAGQEKCPARPEVVLIIGAQVHAADMLPLGVADCDIDDRAHSRRIERRAGLVDETSRQSGYQRIHLGGRRVVNDEVVVERVEEGGYGARDRRCDPTAIVDVEVGRLQAEARNEPWLPLDGARPGRRPFRLEARSTSLKQKDGRADRLRRGREEESGNEVALLVSG